MKIKNYSLLCLVAVLATTACKKNGTVPKTKIDTDVYIVGSMISATGKSVAAYWKNGVPHTLSADTTVDCYANGIAVDGANVYVTGFYSINNDTRTMPVYWKNGTRTKLTLPDPDTTTTSYPRGIAVNSNGVVYIAGEIDGSNGRYSAVYWKDNGTPTNLLPSDGSGAYAVAVNTTDVYFAGYAYYSTDYSAIPSIATYWTSSGPQPAKDHLLGYAYAIALNGSDVYTAGESYTGAGGIRTATYWTNGTPTYLSPDTVGVAWAIAIKDNIIYTAGSHRDPVIGKNVAAYWKGQKRIPLSLVDNNNNTYLAPAYANGIALIDNDVYVVGYAHDQNNKEVALCWKNGQIKPLAPGCFEAHGIVIVTQQH